MEIQNKITVQQAQSLALKVMKETGNNKYYRVGQSLFNNLPSELAEEIRGTELDFFYWANDVMVWDALYENMVEAIHHEKE